MAHEKPARRLVDQRGRRSGTVQGIKQMQSTYWLEKVLKMISLYVNALLCTLQHIVIHAMQISGINSPNLHHVYDSMLQRAQKCIDVQGDHFQHLLQPVSTLPLHLFPCTESETYVGLRDGGPVFRAPLCSLH